MLKVMIVDDEYLLRELIKTAVPWSELGFVIVAEAEDGEEALEKTRQFRPQVILIDINIPFINGLELARIVQANYPEIKIIILTGYGEFEYAREAIRIGVCNYIVKPVNSEELCQALVKAKEEIVREEQQRQQITRLQTENQKSFELRREQFLNSLLAATEDSETVLADKLDSFHTGIAPELITVLVIELDNCDGSAAAAMETDSNLRREAAWRVMNEIATESVTGAPFVGPANRVVVLFNDPAATTGAIRQSYRVAAKIKDRIRERLGYTVSVGIGGCHDTYACIAVSYREALHALSNKFREGKDRVFEYQPMENRAPGGWVMNFDKDDLLVSLRVGDQNKVLETVEKVFAEIAASQMPREYAQIPVMELYALIALFCKEAEIMPGELEDGDFLARLNRLETVAELRLWIRGICETVLCKAEERKKSRPAALVEKAKEYIEANFRNPLLSLEEIADHVFVNPCYLSCAFRKETGYTMIEYLTKVRLRKAKEMMDANPHCQISILAEQIGYNDPYYFSKCFKKQFGITPTKYSEEKGR